MLDDKLHFFTSITQEADDPASPIDIALNDSLRAIIASSGLNRIQASVSGVVLSGRDSVTSAPLGQYVIRDTLLGGIVRQVFVYAPGDPQALWSVNFSFVEQMPSDSLGYQRLIAGGYAVAGLGKGNYLPIQILPIPELHRVFTGRADYTAGSDLTVSAEYALSTFDRNRLSSLDDAGNTGGAYKFQAEYHPKSLSLGGTSLGQLKLSVSDRFVDSRFASLDRSNEIEFNRNWNLTKPLVGDEEIREADMSYQPLKTVHLDAQYGLLERAGSTKSSRTILNASSVDSAAPRMAITSELITNEDLVSPDKSVWLRQKGNISYSFWKIEPGLRVELENRKENVPSSDSLFGGSFRYLEFAPSLTFANLDPLRASVEVQARTEDSALAGNMTRAFRSLTEMYDMQLREWNSLSASLSLSTRKTDPSHEFAEAGNTEINTTLVRSQVRFAPLRRAVDMDALYEFSH